ncbi:MAG: hypothetical protein Q9162_001272 [Coniocarpon cinnabarinum]
MSAIRALFTPLTLSAPTSSSIPTAVPAFLYGTAWKGEQSAKLVHAALDSGFRAIDTAAQPRHYREDLVGQGIRSALADGRLKRGDLFLQTKYSPPSGQDPGRIPYDPRASITEQVQTSVKSSLHNLRVDGDANSPANESTYIDCLVLHSPLSEYNHTLEAWRASESFVPDQVKHLGISNVNLPILQGLYKDAKIKPSVVQNRFHRETFYDVGLRRWCRKQGITYQAFWTLTANPRLLHSAPVKDLSARAGVAPESALYAYVLSLEGMTVCNGTMTHMKEDLEALGKVRAWVARHESEWRNLEKHFKDLIGENADAGDVVEPSAADLKPAAAIKTKGLV